MADHEHQDTPPDGEQTGEHPEQEHQEQPETETSEAPPQDEEPASDVPDEGQAGQEVEPTLGLDEFLAAHPIRPAAEAMLRRWLTQHGKDSYGHYPLHEWEGYYQEMLRAT